jgi:hypothetical protein
VRTADNGSATSNFTVYTIYRIKSFCSSNTTLSSDTDLSTIGSDPYDPENTTLVAPTTPGTYVVEFFADYTNVVSPETNNSNNSICRTFTVVAIPSITVTRPHAFMSFSTTTSTNIEWTSSNISGNISIELYKGGFYVSTIEANANNNGIYPWGISSNIVAGTDYSIKITSLSNNSIFDFSDNFQITSTHVLCSPTIIPNILPGMTSRHLIVNEPMLYNAPANSAQTLPGVGNNCGYSQNCDPDGDNVYKVLVVYTTAATNELSSDNISLKNSARTEIDKLNKAYVNSGIEMQAQLVGAIELGPSFEEYNNRNTGPFSQTATRNNTANDFSLLVNNARVKVERDMRAADAVIFVTSALGYSAVAMVTEACEFNAFLLVDLSVFKYFSLQHEMGHLHGCHHSHENPIPTSIHHGHRTCECRTLLEYHNTNCPQGNLSMRTLQFSNPNRLFRGTSCNQQPSGVSGVSNCSEMINSSNRRRAFANFRNDGLTIENCSSTNNLNISFGTATSNWIRFKDECGNQFSSSFTIPPNQSQKIIVDIDWTDFGFNGNTTQNGNIELITNAPSANQNIIVEAIPQNQRAQIVPFFNHVRPIASAVTNAFFGIIQDGLYNPLGRTDEAIGGSLVRAAPGFVNGDTFVVSSQGYETMKIPVDSTLSQSFRIIIPLFDRLSTNVVNPYFKRDTTALVTSQPFIPMKVGASSNALAAEIYTSGVWVGIPLDTTFDYSLSRVGKNHLQTRIIGTAGDTTILRQKAYYYPLNILDTFSYEVTITTPAILNNANLFLNQEYIGRLSTGNSTYRVPATIEQDYQILVEKNGYKEFFIPSLAGRQIVLNSTVRPVSNNTKVLSGFSTDSIQYAGTLIGITAKYTGSNNLEIKRVPVSISNGSYTPIIQEQFEVNKSQPDNDLIELRIGLDDPFDFVATGISYDILIERSGIQQIYSTSHPDIDFDEEFQVLKIKNLQGGEKITIVTLTIDLPVELTQFRISKADEARRKVNVQWSTASEINCEKFEVLHARDKMDFKKVGETICMGKETTPYDYSILHEANVGDNYYRLKQIDEDGSSSLSDIRHIYFNGFGENFVILPNPSNGEFSIYFNEDINQSYRVQIFSVVGQELIPKDLIKKSDSCILDVSFFGNGIYIIKLVSNNNSWVKHIQLIK